MTSVSVVVRARDEEAAIGEALALLRAQTLQAELIVVDSGSRDRTVEIAEHSGAKVVRIAAERFTFGRSLNLGCREASGEVIAAVSAHAYVRDRGWLERLLSHLREPGVACASGAVHGPDRTPLAGPLRLDAATAEGNPFFGYSNAAGGFRADLWRQRPFRDDMPGTEDKEWAWHWLKRGLVTVVDPALVVDHDHAKDGLAESYERYRRELEGYAMFLDLPRRDRRDLLREWWSDQGLHRSKARARLDPRRAARLLGAHRGRAAGRASRSGGG